MRFILNLKEVFNLKEDGVIKDIPNTKGNYRITNYGRIYSMTSGKYIVSIINENGYYQSLIRINNKNVNVRNHRLVGIVFVPNPNNYPCVCHDDDNKLNNFYTNLFWGTVDTNNKHNNRYDRISKTSGHSIKVFKLTDGKFVEISIENSINNVSKNYHISFNDIYQSIRLGIGYYSRSGCYLFKYNT